MNSFGSFNAFWDTTEGSVEVNYFRYHDLFETPSHLHDEYALIALADGATDYVQFGTREHVHRGDFLITNGNTLHASVHAAGGRRTEGVALTFTAAAFHDFLGRAGVEREHPARQCILMHKVSLPEALPLVDALVREISESRPPSKRIMEGLATALSLQVLRAWPRLLIREHSPGPRGSMPRRRLIRTLEYMAATRKRDFSIDTLCQALHVTRRELYASFALTTGGDTPAACYRSLLLRRAEEALRSPEFSSVKRIAYDLGFRDPSHFVASFRKARGVTPGVVARSPRRGTLSADCGR